MRHRLFAAFFAALLFAFATELASAGTTTNATWTGGGGTSNNGWNFNSGQNWSGSNQPQGGSTATIIHFAGSTSLNPNCDYGAFTQEGSIIFDAGASSFTLGGNAIKLALKIENLSSNLQTYNQAGLSLTGQGAAAVELDPTNGDLTIGNAGSIFVDNTGGNVTTELDVFGAHTLTLNAALKDGSGPGKLVLQSAFTGTVVFNAANTYSGGTFINGGTLQINSGGSAVGTLTLGNTTGASNSSLAIGGTTGGVTVSNAITERTGSSGTKTFSGLNTSGTNTFSGVVTLNDNLGQASSAGGTGILDFSNQVTAASAQTLTITGGIVQLSGTADNSNLAVTVNNGATLNLNKTSTSGAHAFGGSSTINQGGTMKITGTGGDQIFNNAGLTVNGTFDLNAQSETIDALNGASTGIVTNSATGTSTLTTGGNGGGGTFSGVLQDGGSGKVLALTKIGAGTLTLSGTNTYTGLTTISVGTINIQNNSGLGSTSNGTSITSGAALELQGGITVGAEALALNGAGAAGGALRNVSSNNTYGGLITLGSASTITSVTAGANVLTLSGGLALGANRITVNGAGDTTVMTTGITGTTGGDILKQGSGTLNLNVASTFVGSGAGNANAAFIDQGTISVGATGALGATDGSTTGLVNMGSAGTGGLNTTLNISNSGVTLANPVLVRYLQTGGKTLSGTFTSGSSTFSGAISLADHLSIAAANGGTLLFTGVISQAAGTGSNTPGAGLVNNTSPSGGFSTNGPGVIINSGTSSTGIVEYDNAMSYVGDTVVNSGTLQFNGSGSLLNSTIRLGNLGASTLNLISPTGSTLNVTVNVRPSTGLKTISASNTSGTSTLGGHFALDDNATVVEASATGTLAITQVRAGGAGTITGTDIKGFTLTLTPTGTISISGDIYNSTGSGNILMNGSGLLTFSGSSANTYTGLTTVSNGELDLNKTGVQAMGGNLTISGGTVKFLQSNQLATSAMVLLSSGTLDLNGQSQTVVDMTNNGGIFRTGAGTWTGTGASMTWAGGTNTVNTGGTIIDNHLTITAGTNEVQAGGLVQLSLTGLTMNGGSVTLDADATSPGKLSLMSNVSANDGTTSTIATSSPTNPGVVDLNGATRTFTIGTSNAATTLNVSARIQGTSGALTKAGPGTLNLTGNNTYTGSTTVSAGTLKLANTSGQALSGGGTVTVNSSGTLLMGANNQITTSSGLSLGGGNIDAGGFSQGTGGTSVVSPGTVGLGALTLNSTSTIDLTNTSVLHFTASNLQTWAGTLSILDWNGTATTGGGAEQLLFGTSTTGITATQLAEIQFVNPTGMATGTYNAVFATDGTGEIVPGLTVVPEPGTWAAGALAFAGLLLSQRKRFKKSCQAKPYLS